MCVGTVVSRGETAAFGVELGSLFLPVLVCIYMHIYI